MATARGTPPLRRTRRGSSPLVAPPNTVGGTPYVEEAATLGSELVALLQTSTTRKRAKANASLDEALDHRDRLWTLLHDGYEGVWKMGAILWGRRVDEHVPPLLSRMATPTTKPTSPTA